MPSARLKINTSVVWPMYYVECGFGGSWGHEVLKFFCLGICFDKMVKCDQSKEVAYIKQLQEGGRGGGGFVASRVSQHVGQIVGRYTAH